MFVGIFWFLSNDLISVIVLIFVNWICIRFFKLCYYSRNPKLTTWLTLRVTCKSTTFISNDYLRNEEKSAIDFFFSHFKRSVILMILFITYSRLRHTDENELLLWEFRIEEVTLELMKIEEIDHDMSPDMSYLKGFYRKKSFRRLSFVFHIVSTEILTVSTAKLDFILISRTWNQGKSLEFKDAGV